ncbi:hypothetical protein WJ0W_003580 [Paenibacillus melissococcoides]|uniref:Uncharacterized protein n=1 Tax=Paenibacillus melissococcoides TaxID=2912268 RepID=A0ABM9G416_9BACL|nr:MULTISPECIES: hypothetical protein [Paenibacillus]GIO82657.1 hypothetical protein J6TS7_62670 [Paenibacillus dendritiformis]CAH8246345.1 hypothetical protein WJ0W_003580 [Paenibacillus melissococcoides]CAH8714466.1 hypothetical protein HTL2_003952 [Paenibacillus melissococcoides]CAH8715422.1 hypothetical protein WDD9_004219 [Paenibacillus melissococcoides]
MLTYEYSNHPVARLFSFLQHVTLPVPVRPAAIVSGLTEDDVRLALRDSPDYVVDGESIRSRTPYEKALMDMRQRLGEEMTVMEACWLYRELAGKLVNTFMEEQQHEEAV